MCFHTGERSYSRCRSSGSLSTPGNITKSQIWCTVKRTVDPMFGPVAFERITVSEVASDLFSTKCVLIDLDDFTSNLRTHTGERLCRCEVCDAIFSLSYDRKNLMHTQSLTLVKIHF